MDNSNFMYLYIYRLNFIVERFVVRRAFFYPKLFNSVLYFELLDGTSLEISWWRFSAFCLSLSIHEEIEKANKKRLVIYDNEHPI